MSSGGSRSSGTQLSGPQIQIGREIRNFLQGLDPSVETSRIGQGATPFEGERIAGLPQEAVLARELLGMFDPTQFQAETGGAIERALSGKPAADLSERATESFFQDAVAAPMFRTFDREIAPRLKDAAASQGALFSTARTQQEGDALQGLQTGLAANLAKEQMQNQRIEAELLERAATRSMQAIPMANAQRLQPLAEGSALLRAAAPFQAQEQAELDHTFSEFQRLLPENDPFLARAMQFFGSQQPMAYENRFTGGALGSGLGLGAGAGAGALIGSSMGNPLLGAGIGAMMGTGVGGGLGSFFGK